MFAKTHRKDSFHINLVCVCYYYHLLPDSVIGDNISVVLRLWSELKSSAIMPSKFDTLFCHFLFDSIFSVDDSHNRLCRSRLYTIVSWTTIHICKTINWKHVRWKKKSNWKFHKSDLKSFPIEWFHRYFFQRLDDASLCAQEIYLFILKCTCSWSFVIRGMIAKKNIVCMKRERDSPPKHRAEYRKKIRNQNVSFAR